MSNQRIAYEKLTLNKSQSKQHFNKRIGEQSFDDFKNPL